MEYQIYHIKYGDISNSNLHALVSSSDEERAWSLLERNINSEGKSFKRIVIKRLKDTEVKAPREEVVHIQEYKKSEIQAKFDIQAQPSKS